MEVHDMLIIERKDERRATISALNRAINRLVDTDSVDEEEKQYLTKLLEAKDYLEKNARVSRLSLSWFVKPKVARVLLQEERIRTLYDMCQTDIRQMRAVLRNERVSLPQILIYLHPEK